MSCSSMEEDLVLASLKCPPNAKEVYDKVSEFIINCQTKQSRKIVLVTSGGTSVPLEKSGVRQIENFSTGWRGSTSAEEFLKKGYAVIFLHRKNSTFPFMRHLVEGEGPLIQHLHAEDEKLYFETTDENILNDVRAFHAYAGAGLFLPIHFVTVDQYLHLLHVVCVAMRPVGSNAMVYLAAAVSDFYIPYDELPEHKIQSGNLESFTIKLQLVPKTIKQLTEKWVRNAFVVSFKLETDETILLEKATTSLDRYCHHVVVANILRTKASKVTIVTKQKVFAIELSEQDTLLKVEIENKIIQYLNDLHEKYISSL